MKRYERYKPSAIEWIGKIPEHWDITKLKFMTDNLDKNRIPLSSSERSVKRGEYPYYGATGIIDYIDGYIFDGEYVLIGEDGAPFFQKNRDVAFVASGKFWVNNHAHILRTREGYLPKVIAHQLNCVDYREYITGSTRDKLTQDELNEIRLINIPKEEQATIVDYLGHKTAQIDALTAKKQKLIDLLSEEKTAIINQAVTKGLNPNAPMKDSGIPWMGEIPEHWDFKKLKYVAVIKSSNVDKKSYDDEKKVLLCNYLDVYKHEFIDNSFLFMEATANENEIAKFSIKKGDVLVTKDSETPDDIASPAYIKEDLENVICGYHLAQIRANNIELIGEYLFRLFQSRKLNSHFEISANGITRFGLSVDSFQQVFVPLPPIKEQSDITRYIQTGNQRIDVTISKIEREISLLHEYRTALISDAVTGKIDVRGVS